MIPNLSECVNFLTELQENNERDWFSLNKSYYNRANSLFYDFTNSLIASISSFDNTVRYLEAKDCVFRIYRDVRFSKVKLPYKTNMGAYIARGGKKSPFAGYYFHLEPNASFISGGIYMANPKIMKKLRENFDTYSDQFLDIVESPSFSDTFSGLGEEKLKRIPQGFSPNSPVAKYLLLKHITPIHRLNNDDIGSGEIFFEKASSIYTKMFPLIQFLNSAIEQDRSH